jgi:uncharacterized LabA/DUF88 family protein
MSTRINYKKLKNLFLNTGDHLVSACYYTALPNDYDMEEKHKTFLKILKKDVRVRVRSVPLLTQTTNTEGAPPQFNRYSKGEDILLACDMVKGAYTNQYDVCILITGDGDFVPAVNAVQDAGKPVIVASFHNSLSHALELEASEVVYLDEFLDRIKL